MATFVKLKRMIVIDRSWIVKTSDYAFLPLSRGVREELAILRSMEVALFSNLVHTAFLVRRYREYLRQLCARYCINIT